MCTEPLPQFYCHIINAFSFFIRNLFLILSFLFHPTKTINAFDKFLSSSKVFRHNPDSFFLLRAQLSKMNTVL